VCACVTREEKDFLFQWFLRDLTVSAVLSKNEIITKRTFPPVTSCRQLYPNHKSYDSRKHLSATLLLYKVSFTYCSMPFISMQRKLLVSQLFKMHLFFFSKDISFLIYSRKLL